MPLARELAREGIRVLAIAPGFFETPMASGLKEAAQTQIMAAVPFPKRMGRPEEFAELVYDQDEDSQLDQDEVLVDRGARVPALLPNWNRNLPLPSNF